MEIPKYQKRKPDKETELLRIWELEKDSEESKEFEEKTKDSTEITYKDMKIKMTGFTELRDNKTNELKLAYKFLPIEAYPLTIKLSNVKLSSERLLLLM